jgi:hypothetical protein
MKTKLISLKTILLAVIALFIFSARTNAQVEAKITQSFNVVGDGWKKVFRYGTPVTVFAYKHKGDVYSLGIYSDDYAGIIDLNIYPFDIEEKLLKKLPNAQGKNAEQKLLDYYKIACSKAREKAFSGKYKTTAPYLTSRRYSRYYPSKNEPITIIGHKKMRDLFDRTYYQYAIVNDNCAGIYETSPTDNVVLIDIPLYYMPSTDDPQVKTIIDREKAVFVKKQQEKERRIEEEKKAQAEKEKEEKRRMEAEYQAYRDSMAAAKVEQDMAEMKRCSPAIIKVGGWHMDSAGGIEVDITFTNCTSQKVKYVYFRGYFLNAVGDKCRNDITRSTEWKYRGVGPIDAMPKELQKNYYPNVEFWRFGNPKFYSSIAHTFRLSSVTIEYMNGKKTTLSGAELKKRVKYTD